MAQIILIFVLMKFIYIQSLAIKKNVDFPFRISIMESIVNSYIKSFLIRPFKEISNAIYLKNKVERMELLNAMEFCDIADELIELFIEEQLVFTEIKQFKILKSLFSTIGYNFNIKPIILWKSFDERVVKFSDIKSTQFHFNSTDFATTCLGEMVDYSNFRESLQQLNKSQNLNSRKHDLSTYKEVAGVYHFINTKGEVIYVGKAKKIRRRLQSHFSGKSKSNTIDYSQVDSIDVTYTGNDIIAQLLESENIKNLQPVYNTQQKIDPLPFVVHVSQTAKGIIKLQITKKEYKDNLPEKFYNRNSVKQELLKFSIQYNLCRKHCGVESSKGFCNNVKILNEKCVCNKEEPIDYYNKRFNKAFIQFKNRKSLVIYKLTGRHIEEDAFVFTINGIYQGYGYINKSEFVATENDILSYMKPQSNTYDSSRIVDSLKRNVKPENIFAIL